MFKALLLGALRRVLWSDEVIDLLRDAIASAIASSQAVEALTDGVNEKLKVLSAKFDGLGLKGKLLKRYVVELVKDIAKDDPTVANAVALGKPYFEAVLDGLDPEELATATTPVLDLVRFKAQLVAQRFGFSE